MANSPGRKIQIIVSGKKSVITSRISSKQLLQPEKNNLSLFAIQKSNQCELKLNILSLYLFDLKS